MFLGVLVQKVQKKTYQKLTIGVETGYNVDFYTLRTRNYTMIENVNVGDKVFFSGHFTNKKHSSSFILRDIGKSEFTQCSDCNLPLTSNTCLMKHDKDAQKLNGEWRVVHKIVRGGNIKVFFKKTHFVFAAVASTKQWYYCVFKKLHDRDSVFINGWRYKNKTSITMITKKPNPNDKNTQ